MNAIQAINHYEGEFAPEVDTLGIVTVTDAPEGIRGDSANNVQKSVTMETGITVQAPLFIKTGEKIKIDTRTGKYMERA